MKPLNKIIKKIRFWLIVRLFTDDEKYMIIMAIDDRMNNLDRIAIAKKWPDYDNMKSDNSDYSKLRAIFSTKDMN